MSDLINWLEWENVLQLLIEKLRACKILHYSMNTKKLEANDFTD